MKLYFCLALAILAGCAINKGPNKSQIFPVEYKGYYKYQFSGQNMSFFSLGSTDNDDYVEQCSTLGSKIKDYYFWYSDDKIGYPVTINGNKEKLFGYKAQKDNVRHAIYKLDTNKEYVDDYKRASLFLSGNDKKILSSPSGFIYVIHRSNLYPTVYPLIKITKEEFDNACN
jgi:hypothetical protein